MTQTLDRERRQKFDKIILAWIADSPAITDVTGDESLLSEETEKLAVLLVAAARSRTEIQAEEKKPDIVDAILEQDAKAKTQHDTLAAFEVAFKLDPGNIAWFNQKPEWTRLRKKLVEKYLTDPDYFKKYHKWYTEEGKFAGGMNVQQMRRDPDGFVLALNIFEAASVEIPQNPEREEGKGFYA